MLPMGIQNLIFQLLNLSFHSNTLYCTDIYEKRVHRSINISNGIVCFIMFNQCLIHNIQDILLVHPHTKNTFIGSFAIFFELPSWTWLFNRSIDESRKKCSAFIIFWLYDAHNFMWTSIIWHVWWWWHKNI